MGIVYKARQLNLKRLVALKRILSGSHADVDETARFRREAEAAAQLQHPNIVHVYDILEADGCLYCSLEFVEGGSLDKRLTGQPSPPRQAAELVEVLARAVHFAHRHGIIHRDLKPSNVLLTQDGTPKITDFGLAKRIDVPADQTPTGAILGTPGYMAPEQASGQVKAIGPAADVYALGVILYELLSGRRPFQAATTLELLQQVVSQAPAPPSRLEPSVPADLEAICLKCLEKEPARRYGSAQELANELRAWLAAQPLPLPTASAEGAVSPETLPPGQTLPPTAVSANVPRPPGWRRRLRWLLAAAATAIVVVLLLVWLKWLIDRPSPSPEGEPSWALFSTGGAEGEVFDRIAFPTRTVGYAASRQALYKTEDGGASWRRIRENKSPERVHLLRFQDAQTGWLGTDQMFRTEDGGASWSPVRWDQSMRIVSGLAIGADGWMLAGGNAAQGDLILYRKAGDRAGWDKLDPEATGYWGGSGHPFRRWFVGEMAVAGDRVALVALFAGYEDRGVLLRTENGGDTWTAVLTPDHELYGVQFTDNRHGWLTGSGGSLWRTADGGLTWQPQANPAGITLGCLAFAPKGGALGLAALWKGDILMTHNGGGDWETVHVDLEYSLPSAAVVDGGCAYVLGSDGRVARYLDPAIPAVK
jgi:photosystem II stability/assembly factor-like uncharacterized protein